MTGERPVVTFTTDFGTQDGYVGAMAGVVLSRCPDARIVAITHDVPPQDVRAGAWALGNAWRFFPVGTIHVAVVDPGVGSARRGILLKAAGQTFTGPDNGILPAALGDVPIEAVHELTNVAARAENPSATFHGRDVFAWVAGWLAAGNDWSAVGSPIPAGDLVRLPDEQPRIVREGGKPTLVGRAMLADRFGNLVTTIRADFVDEHLGGMSPRAFVAGEEVAWGRTFSDVPVGEAIAYLGSSSFVEVAVNMGRAVERFGNDAEVKLVGREVG